MQTNPDRAATIAAVDDGRARFDAFRDAVDALQARVDPARAEARRSLDHNADVVRFWVLGTGIVILLSVAGVALTLRRQLVVPRQRLADAVRGRRAR